MEINAALVICQCKKVNSSLCNIHALSLLRFWLFWSHSQPCKRWFGAIVWRASHRHTQSIPLHSPAHTQLQGWLVFPQKRLTDFWAVAPGYVKTVEGNRENFGPFNHFYWKSLEWSHLVVIDWFFFLKVTDWLLREWKVTLGGSSSNGMTQSVILRSVLYPLPDSLTGLVCRPTHLVEILTS